MSNQIETIVEVQTENRNRKTVFWRGILVVPVYLFLASFGPWASSENDLQFGDIMTLASPLLLIPTALALIFRGVYPSYVLSFNHALMELETRISTYIFLLNDDYPSIERNPRVAVIFPDVEGGAKLNRWMPLVKWFLAIPLYFVGLAYAVAALVVTFLAWIITSITGRYPQWAVQIVLGTMQFWNRVYGYVIVLVTDEYPSFSL